MNGLRMKACDGPAGQAQNGGANRSSDLSQYDPADAMMDLFVSRHDAYAVQGSREEIKAGRAYAKIDGVVTPELIREHLEGKKTIGTYCIDPKTQTTRAVIWDFDSEIKASQEGPGPEKVIEGLKPQVDKLLAAIKEHKFDSQAVLIEFSGLKGIHVWLFFDPPIPSLLTYAIGREIAEAAQVQCEVFPKQRELVSAYGNLVKLPLGIHRGSGLRSTIYDTEWHQVTLDYLPRIDPVFIAVDDKRVHELKTQLENKYRPWMEVEAGRGRPYEGEDPPCVVGYLSGRSIPIGQRHAIFHRLGCYYLTFKGLAGTEDDWKQVRHILEEWNKHNAPPYDSVRFEEEWSKLAKGYEYKYGCSDEYWRKTCDPARCTIRQRMITNLPNEVSVEAIEKAKALMKDPVAFIQHLQHCLDYRLAGEYRNRLFMFLAAVSARVQTTLVRLYAPNAAGKKMLYYWLPEFIGPENVVTLSSSTAAWLKRKVLKGFDTRNKVVVLIEERGDFQGQTKYQFEQIYSEDKIKIGFNIRGEGGDWEPIEVELQGPLTFITTSTELEESFHAITREWEVNPDESPEQSKRISEWDDWRELRSLKELEEEDEEIEVIRAYISLLKSYGRYVVPFTRQLSFVYRTLGDRRKKPDLKRLIRTAAFLFQELCPKDEENKILFAAPFTFDIVAGAASEIIAVSRGGLNRTERRLWDFLSKHYDEILSVTRDGRAPEEDQMRDGKLVREGRPAEGFTVADLSQRPEFSDLHEQTLRDNLRGLTRKGRIVQTVSGRGRPGVWMAVQGNAVLNLEAAESGLIPSLEPISVSHLKFQSSRIYERTGTAPTLVPGWDEVLPSLNLELWNFRIPSESLLLGLKEAELADSSSRSRILELPEAPTAPASSTAPDPFAKYVRKV